MSTPRCSRCGYPLHICDCHYDYLSDPPDYGAVVRTSANPYSYNGSYDLREDECPDCGFDIPSGLCECRPGIPPYTPYTNADRQDDVEKGRPMGDGAAFYTDDGS